MSNDVLGKRVAINITNKEAGNLARQFAKIEGTTLTEAIVTALREAIAHRRGRETPRQTAARLRVEFGVELSERARRPLPRAVYDEMSGEG
jgi:antitoxin VapB